MKYEMLVLSTTITKFEATDDSEALKRFRATPKGRELRGEREGDYPLGRLIAYKDTAGNEHVANLRATL